MSKNRQSDSGNDSLRVVDAIRFIQHFSRGKEDYITILRID